MKVLSVIQARIGSTRLPGKVLLKIQGKTILEHIVDFLKFSKLTDQIIVATTNLSVDDKIVNLMNDLQIDYFRGSSDDVLCRYFECAKAFNGDLIVRITADDPIIVPELIDEVISTCKQTGCDYATNLLHRTYPLGITGEAFTFSILKKLHEKQIDPMSREHVTHHMLENPHLYNIREIFAPSDLVRSNWRLTIDHEEDFQLISEIFSRLYTPNSYIRYPSLVKYLDKNNDLLKINKKYYY